MATTIGMPLSVALNDAEDVDGKGTGRGGDEGYGNGYEDVMMRTITVPLTMATVSDASVHVAGVVNGVAYTGGLPDHVPLAVTGAQERTEEQPVR
jgi:hypothetical protein